MKIVKPGHKYEAAHFVDKNAFTVIQFVEKEPSSPGSTDLKLVNDGVTNEELLEVVLNRLNYLQAAFPCRENAVAITNIQQGLLWLNERTRQRKERNVEGTNQK